jgi:predicted RNA-binding protein YlxR (DUF448 family)
VRFAVVDGMLTEGRTLSGRGVYTCPSEACFEQARARRAFGRRLRANVVVEPELRRLYTGESDG